jgi:MFS family permease
MFACAYGAAFGAIQQVQQIVPGLPDVRQTTQGLPPPRAALATQEVAANVTKVQEIGGLAGRVALAYLAVIILSRRKLIRLFQLPGLLVMPLTFAVAGTTHLNWLYVGMFFAGFFTVGQFSFWGNYLPRVYPLHLRGTGESFAANIGGRLIGTSFAWITATLAVTSDRAFAPTKVAYVAAVVGTSAYVIGFIASFWLPEPDESKLRDS